MRHYRLSATSSCIVYVWIIGLLFLLFNCIAILFIQWDMDNKNYSAMNHISKSFKVSQDNAEFGNASEKGAVLIGDLLKDLPFHFNTRDIKADARKTYFAQNSVVVGNSWYNHSSLGQITLATQCSIDLMDILLEVAETWRGPMSVAIFVPGVDFYIAKIYIAYLRFCSQIVRSKATFHFLYQLDMPPHLTVSYHKHVLPPCARSIEALPLLMRYRENSFKRWRQKILYPQNHMRNVAVRGCNTTFHILTDIETVPVPRLAEKLNIFLGDQKTKSCTKCVFVLPTYEMYEDLPIPHNKSDLLERIRNGQCRQYHVTYCLHNHYATNYSLWEIIPDSGHLVAAYKINYDYLYEPFYIADSSVPSYDERFIGYGYTRISQVLETYLAGFEFWVLNPAFAIHIGWEKNVSTWREQQIESNSKYFLDFKNEMVLKYKAYDAFLLDK